MKTLVELAKEASAARWSDLEKEQMTYYHKI